jgi:hypothetical protein
LKKILGMKNKEKILGMKNKEKNELKNVRL